MLGTSEHRHGSHRTSARTTTRPRAARCGRAARKGASVGRLALICIAKEAMGASRYRVLEKEAEELSTRGGW